MRDPTALMWAEACELLARAEQLQRQFFFIGSREHCPAWEPPVDMVETEREIIVCVALPGVSGQQIEILFEADSLVISGERLLPSAMRAALIHRLEIPRGRFKRRVALPTEAVELKRRDLIDGCLVLTLGKA